MSGANLMPMHVGGRDFLWDFDFTTLSLGAHSASSFLTSTSAGNPRGLTFTRASASTVQTSASTVDSTPSTDDACIGALASSVLGLVLQPCINNGVPNATDLTASWTSGTALVTANATAGPDGVSDANSVVGGSGGFGNFHNFTTSDRATFSAWYKNAGSTNGTNAAEGAGVNTGKAAAVPNSTSWNRVIVSKPALTSMTYFVPCDERNYASVGGQAAASCDIYTGMFQFEFQSEYATEVHKVAGRSGRRRDDRLSHASGNELIATNGQIKFYAKFVPKFDSTHKVHCWDDDSNSDSGDRDWLMFSWGTTSGGGNRNAALFDNATNKLKVQFGGGTTATSTNAIAFSQFDVVEVYIAAGNNVASVAKYRVNGGSWVDLVLATVTAAPAPGANPIGLLMDQPQSVTGVTGQTPCWLQHLSFYNLLAPSGV